MTVPDTAFAAAAARVRAGADPQAAAADLLAALTDAERLWLLDGDEPFLRGSLAVARRGYHRHPWVGGAVARLGIPGIRFTDGPRGVTVGSSTCFPVAMARGATWDPDLEERIGRAMAAEARARGANLLGAVCVNLLRHPAWGRAQETYGEDPVLLGAMGAALTRGIRGGGVMACVKHFALNSMEDTRFTVDVTVDEAALHEVYLPHFKDVVDAGADAVMSAYNSVNGRWCGDDPVLLTDILRTEWGFAGFVVSDWVFGLRDPVGSVAAGLDVEMPFRQQRARALPRALRRGRLRRADVDRAGTRLLAAQLRHSAGPAPAPVDAAAHLALARRVAARSMVLLRNRDLLPVDAVALRRVAVLGPLADRPNLGDGGSSAVRPPSTVSPVHGLRAALPGADVVHEPDPARAAAAATGADLAVVVVGYTAADEGEAVVGLDPAAVGLFPWPLGGRLARAVLPWLIRRTARRSGFPGGDRVSLRLHDADERLIETVAAANPRTVVVLIGGSAIVMGAWRDRVAAVLVAWYPGMAGGHALADVLTGAAEPGGRLPFVVPARPEHLPPFHPTARRVVYDRWWGYRRLDRDGHAPQVPFGFGLGYTTFALADLRVAVTGGALAAEVTATNTGARPGGTVVQLYGVAGTHRQLLGFARVTLAAGATRRVAVTGTPRPLSRRDPATRTWSVPPGRYRVEAARFAGDPDAADTTIDLA